MQKEKKEAGWNEPIRKFNWGAPVVKATVMVVVLLVIACLIFMYGCASTDRAQKMHSVTLPQGNKDPVLGYADDYISVVSNPRVGPLCLTRGLWLITKAEKEGDGTIELKGHIYDQEGGVTRVTLKFTSSQFAMENSGVDLILTTKNSKNFTIVDSAFKADEGIAKDKK